MSKLCRHRETCRLCGSKNVFLFLDLGITPLAGDFLRKEDIGKEPKFPLRVYFCRDCGLVQLLDVVSPEYLFLEYNYMSSVTKTLSGHFREHAKEMVERFLPENSVTVEIGSNDGVLQQPLTELGVRAIGVEPAGNIAKVARERGLEVLNGFFTKEVASKILRDAGRADAVFASNVFAHIDGIQEIMDAIKVVLKENGVFVFEVHYLADLIDGLQYDTIYHEHLCYYSLLPLIPFFKKHGMTLFDVKRMPMHAGAIRGYVKNTKCEPTQNVHALLALERETGLDRPETFTRYSERVREHKKILMSLLSKLKGGGKRICGYGAPGRGNTLLNYCGIDSSMLEYIVDESPVRYGKYTPGTHIPIIQPSETQEQPAIYLMLAWSYEKEILKKSKEFLKGGGKFVVPLPTVRLIP